MDSTVAAGIVDENKKMTSSPPIARGGCPLSAWKHGRRQIAISPVANDRDDDRILKLTREPECCGHGAPGRYPSKDTLTGGQRPGGLFGLRLAHIYDPVNTVRFEDFRHVRGRPTSDPRNAGAVFRLYTDDLNTWVLLLKVPGYSHDRAGGPHRTDKVGDAPLGVSPDLWPRALVMGACVIWVGELVQSHPGSLYERKKKSQREFQTCYTIGFEDGP